MKTTITVIVTTPWETEGIRDAVAAALDDPGNYPPEIDVSDWGVQVHDQAAAEHASRTTAPPRPGVTRHESYVVFAVLPAGNSRSWWVAAQRLSGIAVTWYVRTNDAGMLRFSNAALYAGSAEDSRKTALRNLAERARIL